ncbi:MAG: hypothetical protein Q7T90_12765 [Thiobacillus sp.]|nr:hypothetical protein [Thiobacillus sp.]
MKAYLIDANAKTVSEADIAGLDDVKKRIGYDSVDSDEIDATGDRLFFDERCFLRDQTGKGRFKLDNLAPVADKAVVAGSSDDGATLQDAVVDHTTLERRITWL